MNSRASFNFGREEDDEDETREDMLALSPSSNPENPLDLLTKSYMRRLESHPIMTKAITCSVVSALGALLGNMGSPSKRTNRQAMSPLKKLSEVVAFALYGGLIGGPVSHYWNEWLDKNVKIKSTSWGLLVDQLLAQPPSLFLMHVLLDMFGAGIHELPAAWSRAMQRTGRSVVSSWRFWPAAIYVM